VHSKPADWPSEKIGYLRNAPRALVKGLVKIRREQLDGVVQDRRL